MQCATWGNLEQMGSVQMVVQIAFPLMSRKWVGRQLGVPHMIDVLLQPSMGEVQKELLWFCKTNLHYKEFMDENLHLAMWDESLQWEPYYLSDNLQFSCHCNMWKWSDNPFLCSWYGQSSSEVVCQGRRSDNHNYQHSSLATHNIKGQGSTYRHHKLITVSHCVVMCLATQHSRLT